MATIRRFQVNQATRQAVVVKIGITGPSGSGKTTSALLLAYGLVQGAHPEWSAEDCWAKIAVGDTENRSALYLAGQTFITSVLEAGKIVSRPVTVGQFLHIPFEPPYDPEAWVELIRCAEQTGAEVLVLDSWTHEWAGQGGVLDIKEKLGAGWEHWKTVKPRHQKVKDAVRNSPIAIIGCSRSKTDWTQEQYTDSKGNGRVRPVKIGLKTNQDADDDYEWGVQFRIEHLTHLASTDKDRTSLFAGLDPFVVGPVTGQTLAVWAANGEAQIGSRFWLETQVDRINGAQTEEALRVAFGESWRQANTLGAMDPAKNHSLAHLKAAYDSRKTAIAEEMSKVSGGSAGPLGTVETTVVPVEDAA